LSIQDLPLYQFIEKARFNFDYCPWKRMSGKAEALDKFLLYQVGDLCAEARYHIGSHVQFCHEITYIKSGCGEFIVNGKAYAVGKGDIILTRRGDFHDGFADPVDPFRMFYIGFDILPGKREDSHLRDVSALFTNRTVIVLKRRAEVEPCFHGIFHELINRRAFHDRMIETYIHQLLLSTCRAFHDDIRVRYNPARGTDVQGHLTHQIVTYIDLNLEEIDRIAVLAKELGYSYSHLSHVFQEKMNMSIYEYYDKKRFDRATEMLQRGDMSVTEIAERLRYQSLHSFSKAFSRHYGVNPSTYAMMCRADAAKL